MAKANFIVKKVPTVVSTLKVETKPTTWQSKLKQTISVFAVLALVFQFVIVPLTAQAAPVWPSVWTSPTQCSTDPAGDENPNDGDLVGDSSNPAVGFAVDGNFRYFRERIGGNPNGPGGYAQKAWVVLFQSSPAPYQYLASLNGKTDKVQLWKNTTPDGGVDFNPLHNDPAEDLVFEVDASTNARIVSSGGVYFVDWALPLSAFNGTGITNDTTKFFATSADGNNFNKDHLNCYQAITDLGITKTVNDSTPDEGQTVTFTLTVTNNGPDNATNVVVNDVLPAGLTFVSSNSGSYNNGTGVWTVGSLNNGASASITISATVNSGTENTTITNTATVDGTEFDNVSTNDSASSSVTVNDKPNPTTGTLTVVKVVTNDNGGSKLVSDFPLFVNGNSVTSGASNVLTAGEYTVSETNQTGYTATFSGDCDSNGLVDLAVGDNKTCTITNNDVQPKITVTKTVTNDDEGISVVGDFTLSVGSTQVTSGAQTGINAGMYTVSETGPSGYTATFGGDCDEFGMVTLNVGDVKSCTITNNDNTPPPPTQGTLTVTKVVNNDNAGTSEVSDFPLFVGATSVTSGQANNFDAGSYVVSETNSAGYTATFSGDCDSNGNINIVAGESYKCTITNDDPLPDAPSKPTVELPRCSGQAYTVTINWTGTADLGFGFWVDITTDSTFADYSNKNVGNVLTTTAPDGFSPSLTLDPGTTYYTRIFNGVHSEVASFSVATCPQDPDVTDLSVDKSVNDSTPDEGQTLVYTVSVSNSGPDNASGVVVNDVLPTNLTFVSASSTQGSYNDDTGVWSVGSLNDGESAVLEITVTVNSETAGQTITNTATSSVNTDNNDDNDSDSVDVVVNVQDGRFTLVLTKNGNGNGTVEGSVNGATSTMFCGLDECRETDEKQNFTDTYASGTIVTLTADPSEGSNFDSSWSGACTGNNLVCVITMTSNMNVNAHFALNTTGGGGGTPPPSPTPPPTSSGGGRPPVPPTPQGQVLGTSTPFAGLQMQEPQVLGAVTELPRTGTESAFLGFVLLAAIAVVDRKYKLI